MKAEVKQENRRMAAAFKNPPRRAKRPGVRLPSGVFQPVGSKATALPKLKASAS
jgi:hypothetical protein